MAHKPDSPITPDDALHRLIEGNARYRSGHSRFTGLLPQMLVELAHGQQPFATILGCADSRVPPELIFDAVLGELFVVRVAGNVLSPEVAGSLEYAAAYLDTPLFVVLGHEGCGAVKAAVEAERDGAPVRARIQHLVDAIVPALDGVDASLDPKEQLTAAVEANVRLTLRLIAESPEGRARLESGRMMIVGAVYDLATAHVRLLDLA